VPLYSYQCDTCGLRIENRLLFGKPPKSVTCPECLSIATRRFRPVGTIKFVDRNAETISISTREWEKDQETRKRRQDEDLKSEMSRAKKKLLNTPGIFSKARLEKKRQEMKEAASGS